MRISLSRSVPSAPSGNVMSRRTIESSISVGTRWILSRTVCVGSLSSFSISTLMDINCLPGIGWN